MKIKIKPLSINQAFRGRRFKTPAYEAYEQELMLILPKLTINKEKRLSLTITVGYSSAGSDLGNFEKVFIDVLQKKYGFNDNKIYRELLIKTIVPKNEEFIDFEIEEM